MSNPRGIDVSHHNGVIDWPNVRASGVTFAYLKATEGLGYTDPTFARNRQQATEAGVRVGAYHFLRPDADAGLQAAHFLQVLGTLRFGELPPALDVEFATVADKGDAWRFLTRDQRVQKVGKWLSKVDAAIGKQCLVYTSPGWWNSVLGATTDFSGHPLWVAHYDVETPSLCGRWKSWTVWQHSQYGTCPGVGAGSVDLDVWNGPLPV